MNVTSYNPRTGAPVQSAAATSPAELAATARRAAEAAEFLLRTSPAERRRWLYALADALDVHHGELAKIADLETALGLDRVTAEISRTASQTRFYGDVAADGSYLGLVIDDDASLVRINRPVGPVAVFGASNFPFVLGILGHDTAAAIAAGCPAVGKAHSAHLRLSLCLAEIATTALARAGAPDGTFQVVVGREAGVELVRAPEIAAVAFTGSESGGRALWHIANERAVPIPVYAEMGTVNPVVVTRAGAADLKSVAAGFVACYTNCAGQYCAKPGLFFAPAGLDAAGCVGEALRAAAPAPVMLTRPIADSVTQGLFELRDAGASTVTELAADGAGWSAPAAVLQAPISALVPGSRLLAECFGAVAIVTEYATPEELHSALRLVQPALAAAVWTSADGHDDDVSAVMEILSGKVGRIVVNGWTTGAAHSWAQHHGGPWPATSNPAVTSIGSASLDRFVRPVAYQTVRDEWLPTAARRSNPCGVARRVNGVIETP
jgi:NADP-dependent aldehyde dehydrogenase